MAIYEELKQRRIALGLSRFELAKRLLVTERTILRWEDGDSKNPLHPLLRNGWIAEIEKEEKTVLDAIAVGGKA